MKELLDPKGTPTTDQEEQLKRLIAQAGKEARLKRRDAIDKHVRKIREVVEAAVK